MNKIYIDFETYSDIDITEQGAYIYAQHPSTRILYMSYRIGEDGLTHLWTPGIYNPTNPNQLWVSPTPWPEEMMNFAKGDVQLAFNATFEILIWKHVGERMFPELFKPRELSDWIDIQALCARFRMPQALGKAAKALGCNTEKMAIGKQLIRKCCTPGYNPTQKDFLDLGVYCIVDTDVQVEICQKLPADHLLPIEQELWELTYRMNETGAPIDRTEVQAIVNYLAAYMSEMVKVLPEVTGGLVTTAGQIQRMKKFAADHGIEMTSLDADSIIETLKRDDIPENVRTMLEIRQLLGSSSVKKFVTLLQLDNKGIVQGNLAYHGAGTGRWAGRGFQYHALPRAKVKNPEEVIQMFIDMEPIEDCVQAAKACIRPMIKAPKGFKLIVSDYSGIENRVLAWMCKDEETLDIFRQGLNQYIDMASFVYNKPYQEISEGHNAHIDKYTDMRQFGKLLVLGCGFQMGAKRFKAQSEEKGVIVSLARAKELVDAYRAKYTKVVRMWKANDAAVKTATRYPGKSYDTHRCTFKVVTDRRGWKWLRITLPSGRSMMYAKPAVEDGKYGPTVTYYGFVSKIHKMGRIALTPGLITENIVQGTARDILANGKLTLAKEMPECLLSISVHDEAGGIIPESYVDDNLMDKYNEMMCRPLPWYGNLPLDAEGYIEQRYKKD